MRNLRFLSIGVVCLAAMVFGCGGGVGTIPTSPITISGTAAAPCAITLSGAVTATLSCTAAVVYDAQRGVTGFGLTVQQASPTALVSMKFPGKAQTGTFTDATAGVDLVVMVSNTAGVPPPTWMVMMSPTKQGSVSVSLSDLGAAVTGTGGIAFASPHGTVTAKLEAVQGTGASGTVNLSAKF